MQPPVAATGACATKKEASGFWMLDVKPKYRRCDRASRAKALRYFLRSRDAVTAIEFAVIAIPFFMLIIGIIEVGLLFWAGYELENATAAAARLVRTGRAQTLGYTVSQLRSQLCQNVVILTSCNSKLQISVQTFSTFAGITVPSPVNQNGALQTSFTYAPGAPGSIVLFTTFYPWPLATPLTSSLLANLAGGNYLLQSTFAFRNEPYP